MLVSILMCFLVVDLVFILVFIVFEFDMGLFIRKRLLLKDDWLFSCFIRLGFFVLIDWNIGDLLYIE